nr:IS701 family transposase [Rhodothermus marinus]
MCWITFISWLRPNGSSPPPKRLGFGQGSSTPQRTRAYTRLLKRIPPDTEALWQEVAPFVQPDRGVLVVDDTTLDKPHARKMALVR